MFRSGIVGDYGYVCSVRESVEEAISYIPASLFYGRDGRETLCAIVAALKRGGFLYIAEMWLPTVKPDWSEKKIASFLKGIKPKANGSTLSTVFYWAKQYGYKSDGSQPNRTQIDNPFVSENQKKKERQEAANRAWRFVEFAKEHESLPRVDLLNLPEGSYLASKLYQSIFLNPWIHSC